MDDRISYQTPEGGGLFATIEDLQSELTKQNLGPEYIVSSFGGKVPPNWKIRSLTSNEVHLILRQQP